MKRFHTYRLSSEYVEKVPPSPSLSARRMMKTYFTVTIMMSDHMIRDKAPMRSLREGGSENVEEKT